MRLKKLYCSFAVILELTVYIVFTVSLVSSQTIRCTSPINDPRINKNCEEQCVKGPCPSFCNCKTINGNDSCNALNFAPDKFVSIREDVPAGTNILSIAVRGQEKWTFSLGRSNEVDGSAWTHLKSHLAFKRFGNKYELIVNKTLDLEYIFQRNAIRLSTLILVLNCELPGSPQITTEILLQVLPVNEFPPQFMGAPFQLSIPEDTSIGTRLIMLEQVTVDRDVNPFTKELSKFGIHDYFDATQRDGQSYFGMDNIQKGTIVLKNAVDFEALSALGSPRFVLNVSASDTNGLRAFTEVQINVTDIDDLPPEFFHPSCPLHIRRLRPCPVSFEANVPVGYKGPVHHMRPQDIQAHDMDALDATITYALYSGPGEVQGNVDKFSIDETSGMLFLVSPFLSSTHVDLVVVASENTTKGLTTQAPLKIIVDRELVGMKATMTQWGNATSDGTSKGESNNDETHDFLFLSILIGLAVVTFILILILIILLIKSRHPKDTSSRVHPADDPDTNDEPTTYHASQDDTVKTKTTQSYSSFPASGSDPNKGNNHPRSSDRDTESQLTSHILSSSSQPAKSKTLKVSQAEASSMDKKKAQRFSSGDTSIRGGNKASSKMLDSDGEKMVLSDESSLKSAPQLPMQLSDMPRDSPFHVASPVHKTKGSHLRTSLAPGEMPNHKVHKGMSYIETLERGSISAASLKTRAYTDPLTYNGRAATACKRTHTSHDCRSKKSINDRRLYSKGTTVEKLYSEAMKTPKFRHQHRTIRIPSGVLILQSSPEDHAVDQSGEDSNDSTLSDEPMIDVFCESPDTSLFVSVTTGSPTSKAPNGMNVLSLLPEHQLSESDPNEVITKLNVDRLAPVHSVTPVLKTSRKHSTLAAVKTGNSSSFQPHLWNISLSEREALENRSHGQGKIGIKSKSITANPSDERAANSMRRTSEVENIIRRKKKRRRDSLQRVDRHVTSVNKSQGDDGNLGNGLPDIKESTSKGRIFRLDGSHKHFEDESCQDTSSGLEL